MKGTASSKFATSSRSCELWLVRHAQTAWNVQKRFLGATDLALDTEGVAQAEKLGRALRGRVAMVYASQLKRAAQTASYVGEPVHLDADLAEMDQGDLDGLTGQEALKRFPEFFLEWDRDPTTAMAPGGGSLGACRDRAWEALLRIGHRHRGLEQPVLVVSHQLVIASVSCLLLGSPLSSWREYRVSHGFGIRINLEESMEWGGDLGF
jgi:broad specificity phosphatase PhoE